MPILQTRKSNWCLMAFIVAGCAAVTLTAAPQSAKAPAAAPQAKAPAPWPDADALKARRLTAENRGLFKSETPLEFSLAADFKAVNRDRNVNSTKTFPGTMTIKGADGAPKTIALQLRTRGHVRRMIQTCSFAPLRLEFPADQVAGTPFEGYRNIKLGTHCRDADLYEEYVPREYAAYRIFNLLTPRSFRARLAQATYIDATSNKPLGNRHALFIEDDDDVARRLEGRITNAQKVTFRGLDSETTTLMLLFEYLIGNSDASIYVQHNVVLVETPEKKIYPVPYDFDYAGLVNARYAVPAAQFKLENVRQRIYLGPCRTPEDFAPFFEKTLAVKDSIMKLFDEIPGLTDGYRKDTKDYIDRYYRTIGNPGEVKKAFVDGCNSRAGM